MARTLHNLIDAAEEPTDAWSYGGPRPPLQREALLEGQFELLALADLLRRPNVLPPAALALVALLLWDSASPIYSEHVATTVGEWARAAMRGAAPGS